MSNGVDNGRRRFLTASTVVVGAVAAGFAAVPFVAAWTPSAKAKALGAPVTIDISKLEPGMIIKELWRGNPVWVVQRSPDALQALPGLDGELRDPESQDSIQPDYARNEYRSIKPEILVLLGVCTHLGCSPTYVSAAGPGSDLGGKWAGGFFCPCHGSRFDLAGRVFKGVPAPTNLTVPPYQFVGENTIVIGAEVKA